MKKLLTFMILLCCISAVDMDAARKKAKHVIMIGLDGWSAEGLRKADMSQMPNVKYLMDNGAWTLKKRSVMPSASAINWATMFMGTPTEMHGFDKWNSTKGTIPSTTDNGHGIPPTIYTIMRQQFPKAELGLACDWKGVGAVSDTLAMDFYKYIGTYKGKQILITPEEYAQIAVNYIKEKKPTFFTFYFGITDNIGHNYGWCSPEYMQCQYDVDKGIGLIIQAIKDAGIFDDTIIILSSDHGGKGKGHGKFTLEELETPFVLYGKKVKSGYEMTLPVIQYDTAATIAYILGATIPEDWRGKPVKEAFK